MNMKKLGIIVAIIGSLQLMAQQQNYKIVKVYNDNGKVESVDTILIPDKEKNDSREIDKQITEQLKQHFSKDSISKWEEKMDKMWSSEIKPAISKAAQRLKEAEIDKKMDELRKDKAWDDMKKLLEEQQKSWEKLYKDNQQKIEQWLNDFSKVFEEKEKK